MSIFLEGYVDENGHITVYGTVNLPPGKVTIRVFPIEEFERLQARYNRLKENLTELSQEEWTEFQELFALFL